MSYFVFPRLVDGLICVAFCIVVIVWLLVLEFLQVSYVSGFLCSNFEFCEFVLVVTAGWHNTTFDFSAFGLV